MMGRDLFQFKKKMVAGKCPVFRCRNSSRKGCTGRFALCGSHSKQLWRTNHPERTAFANLRDSARKRKIPFQLTYVEFSTFISTTSYLLDKGSAPHNLHIDRRDATGPYALWNIQVLTATDNVVKGNKERRREYVDAKISAYRRRFATSCKERYTPPEDEDHVPF